VDSTLVYRTRTHEIKEALSNAVTCERRGRYGDAKVWMDRVAEHRAAIAEAYGKTYADVLNEELGALRDKKELGAIEDEYYRLLEDRLHRERLLATAVKDAYEQKIGKDVQVTETPKGYKQAVGFHQTYPGDQVLEKMAPREVKERPQLSVVGREITQDSDAAVVRWGDKEVVRVPFAQAYDPELIGPHADCNVETYHDGAYEAHSRECAGVVEMPPASIAEAVNRRRAEDERTDQLFRLRADFESRYGISPSNEELERFMADGYSLDDVDDTHQLSITHGSNDERVFLVVDADGTELLRAPQGSMSFDDPSDEDPSALLQRAFSLLLEREDCCPEDVMDIEASFDADSGELELEVVMKRRITLGVSLDS
jgi:hypothetical protein